MDLLNIKIQNYRSIDNLEIPIDDKCKIFIGINEAGKTNILDGMHAMHEEFEFDASLDGKTPVGADYTFKDPQVEYEFALSSEEKKKIVAAAFGPEPGAWPFRWGDSSPEAFIDRVLGTHSLVILLKEDGTKERGRYYNTNLQGVKPKTQYYRAKKTLPQQKEIVLSGGRKIRLEPGQVFELPTTKMISPQDIEQHIEPLNVKGIEDILSNASCDFMEQNLPNIVYWKYDEALLITEPINIQEFQKDPDVCKPLSNIFRLAGIKGIGERIEKDFPKDSAFHNLLRKLSSTATKHLKRVWKDYKDIEINIQQRSDRLNVFVLDKKNLYNFRQRSAGFKRFISFLFLLAAEYESNQIPENTIILMDEPDMSLHPSSQRFLLQEILRMSDKNYCFIATHSTFFIDHDNIHRHYIVEKKNEDTVIRPADYQNFAEEEVLFQALGTSVFDILKRTNLFFEGWTDKEMFRMMVRLFRDGIEDSALVDNMGVCWSSSADRICQTIRPLLWDDNRYFLIVSDADRAGLREKAKFEKEFPETQSQFYTYKELSSLELENVGLEDLLPQHIVVKALNDHLESLVKDPSQRFSPPPQSTKSLIDQWQSFCGRHYKSQRNALTEKYKKRIVDSVKSHIEHNAGDPDSLKSEFSNYKVFLERVLSKVKGVTG